MIEHEARYCGLKNIPNLLTQIDDKILNWPEKIFILEVAILFFLSPNFAPTNL